MSAHTGRAYFPHPPVTPVCPCSRPDDEWRSCQVTGPGGGQLLIMRLRGGGHLIESVQIGGCCVTLRGVSNGLYGLYPGVNLLALVFLLSKSAASGDQLREREVLSEHFFLAGLLTHRHDHLASSKPTIPHHRVINPAPLLLPYFFLANYDVVLYFYLLRGFLKRLFDFPLISILSVATADLFQPSTRLPSKISRNFFHSRHSPHRQCLLSTLPSKVPRCEVLPNHTKFPVLEA